MGSPQEVPTVRLASDGGTPSDLEAPEAWKAAVSSAFEACDDHATLDQAHCDEWPCIGLSRTVGLDDATRSCIDDALGESGLSGLVLEMDVKCPSGGFDSVSVVIALDDDSDSTKALNEGPFVRGPLVVGGRVAEALQGWECAGR